MEHSEVHHGRFEVIQILDPVVVKQAYGHIGSRYYSPQRYIQSHEWHYASFC
jgi:hypothetical protein